jgi:glycosyltransferase involved in cell wall biosynthesis
MRTVLISEPHLWDSPIQVGCHHYAREFLRRGWQVVFVSQPLNLFRVIAARHKPDFARRYQLWRSGGEMQEEGQLLTYVPMFLFPVGRALPSVLLNRLHMLVFPRLGSVLAAHGINELDLLWLNGSTDAFMLDRVRFRRSLVRVSDDYMSFKGYGSHLEALLIKVVQRVDVAICTSEPVKRRFSEVRPDVHIVRNGVDYEHFAQTVSTEPDDIHDIPRPRAIYVGAISYWFDWNLLRQIAVLCRNISFVIVGPSFLPPPSFLPHNVYLLGKRPYSAVPAYLHFSDVGIIPFQRSRLVDGVSPIKVYEYLAAGLPIVATRWEELELSGAPVCFADSPQEFADLLVQQAKARKAKDTFQAFARQTTWTVRFQQIMDLCSLP